MVTKIKKSIDNSKRKGDFKKRQQMRIEKKHRQKNADKMEFVDRRELIQSKKKDKKGYENSGQVIVKSVKVEQVKHL